MSCVSSFGEAYAIGERPAGQGTLKGLGLVANEICFPTWAIAFQLTASIAGKFVPEYLKALKLSLHTFIQWLSVDRS